MASSHFDLKLRNLTKRLLGEIYFIWILGFVQFTGCEITEAFMRLTDFKSGSGFQLLIEEDRDPEIKQSHYGSKERHFYINLTFYRKKIYP